MSKADSVLLAVRMQERVMDQPLDRLPGRLPRRFPVGATFVVEGYGGDDGNLRVIARYVVLPGGQRINVPADAAPPAPRAIAFRRRTANAKRSPTKGRSAHNRKKIPHRRGTT
jgi:hypothetical protein